MEICRSGPSGGKVTKSGYEANSSGSWLRLSAGQRSRAATIPVFSGRLRSSRSICPAWPSSRAASLRASVALPTPSGPANSSVCANRPRAIICSSAAVTCGLPQKPSNIRFDGLPDFARYGFHAGAAIDDAEPMWLARRQCGVRLVDLTMELERLLVHARLAVPLGGIARVRPRQAGFRVDIDEQRQIRNQAAAGNAVERHHRLRAQPAPAALIDQRRIGEPVRKHDLARGQGRHDPLIHVLRAAGEIQQHLRGGSQLLIGRIQQNAPDLDANARAARFGRLQHVAAARSQALGQQPHLGGLPRTVHAFKCKEQAPFPHSEPSLSYRAARRCATGLHLRSMLMRWPYNRDEREVAHALVRNAACFSCNRAPALIVGRSPRLMAFYLAARSHFAANILLARRNTATSISSVNLPVEVFCWLG